MPRAPAGTPPRPPRPLRPRRYYRPEETYDELAQTIRALAADDARVVLAYMVRHGHEHTFAELLTGGGSVAPRAAGTGPGSEVLFEVAGRNAADDASRAEPSHATRVVELRRSNLAARGSRGSLDPAAALR